MAKQPISKACFNKFQKSVYSRPLDNLFDNFSHLLAFFLLLSYVSIFQVKKNAFLPHDLLVVSSDLAEDGIVRVYWHVLLINEPRHPIFVY
jgi:hypothetical protein